MKISFNPGPEQKSLVFGNVETNQFFVDVAGRLCQKYCSTSYNVISNPDKTPFSGRSEAKPSDEVVKILPKITEIEF